MVGEDGPPPYWAYGWAGGTVLARHILDHPETVRGRRVLDIGCGSGVVAIAAALSGAGSVTACDSDDCALEATRLNAEANRVTITVKESDLSAMPDVDLVVGGDVFYSAEVAGRMTAFFERCVAAGIKVLIGDPYRVFLPPGRLRRIAEDKVPDFGQGGLARAGVFAFTSRPGVTGPWTPEHEGVDQ
ncbi:MAG: 50S ribosomal protein L11 methyltransferase [Asticcacaulis sp.]